MEGGPHRSSGGCRPFARPARGRGVGHVLREGSGAVAGMPMEGQWKGSGTVNERQWKGSGKVDEWQWKGNGRAVKGQ